MEAIKAEETTSIRGVATEASMLGQSLISGKGEVDVEKV